MMTGAEITPTRSSTSSAIPSGRGCRDAGGVPLASYSARRQATKLSRRSDRRSEAGRFTSAATNRWMTSPGCSTATSGVGSITTAGTTSRLSTRPCDTSTVFWRDGRIGNSSLCDVIGGKQRTGSLASRGDNHRCSHPGGFCRDAAEQWEPDEARVSRPVLRARGGATPLRDSPCDPVPKRQRGERAAPSARDYGQAKADRERREDTDLQGSGRGVRFPGIFVWADVFGENRSGTPGIPAIEEQHPAHGREDPCDDRPLNDMARHHRAGGQVEPRAARLGELLPRRPRQQSVSGARQLRSYAVAPVVALQAQGQATQGRDLSTLAPLRVLRARTPHTAWSRPVVGEGVKSCPRA